MLSHRMYKANAETRSAAPNVRGCRHVTPGCNQRSVTARVASVQPKAIPATTQKAIDAMYPDDSDEQIGVTELEVEGSVPTWLAGDFYRTGPGLLKGYEHWFDGLGMLVNFRFVEGGKVFWQQRFLDSNDYRLYREAGNEPQLTAFKWSPGVVKALTDAIKHNLGLGHGVTDNASVTFYQSQTNAEEGWAFTEAVNGSLAIARNDLATKRNVSDAFKGPGIDGQLLSAHPKLMPNGEHVNIFIPVPFGRLQVVMYTLGDEQTAPKVLYDMEVANRDKRQSWMHDLAVSDTHIAIVEQPFFQSLKALLGFPQEYGVFEWLPEYGTHIRILPLSGDGDAAAPRSFHLPAMFNYHFVNVFNTTHAELGACMCIDAFYADSPASLNMFDLDKVRDANLENSQLILKRVWLPFDEDKEAVIEDLIPDLASYGHWGELAAVSPLARANPDYRYIFGNTMIRPAVVGNQISKFDLKDKKVVAQWDPQGGAILSEAQVILRPGAEQEDDGVVVAPALDGEGRSFVVVLDAGNLEELARAYTPVGVPGGFHSAFMAPLATH